jgi:PadR family transcriptional regulator, regulatory protein PadR
VVDAERDPQLLKGVLPMLVLTLLATDESYGYELVVRLRDVGLDGISPGTVYPVLGRLEREGLLASRLQPSPQGPARKYYRTTAAGDRRREDAAVAWRQLSGVVAAVTTAPDDQEDR